MAYPPISAEGVVTSWNAGDLGGTFYKTLLSNVGVMSANINAQCDSIETTALGDYGRTFIPGLGSWTAQLEGYTLTGTTGTVPEVGNVGNVAIPNSGTTPLTNTQNLYIDSFNLNISCPSQETTYLNATNPSWKSYRPTLITWSGTLNARIDDAANIPMPASLAGAVLAATFTYGTSATAIGNIQVMSVSPAMQVGNVTTCQLGFTGIGQLALGGSNSIFGGSTITLGRIGNTGGASDLPEWSAGTTNYKALIVKYGPTNTLTGFDSFWTSLGISCSVREAVKVSIGVQGVGSLVSS